MKITPKESNTNYAFRLIFQIPEGTILESNKKEVEFQTHKGRIIIRPYGPKTFSKSKKFVLLNEGFNSIEEASLEAEILRSNLLSAGALLGIGIEIKGNGKEFLYPGNIQKRDSNGLRYYIDPDYITIFQNDKKNVFVEMGSPKLKSLISINRLLWALKNGISKRVLLEEKERLAFDLYNNTFFQTNSKARFLIFVTIIELLTEQKSIEANLILEVEEVIKNLSQMSPVGLKLVVEGLNRLKKASIQENCRDLIKKHLGNEASSEWGKIYNIRSGLTHDGRIRCSEKEFVFYSGKLQNFVQTILNNIQTERTSI